MIRPIDLFPKSEGNNKDFWFSSPISRLAAFILSLASWYGLHLLLKSPDMIQKQDIVLRLVVSLVFGAGSIFIYAILVRSFEKRSALELSPKRAGRELLLGVLFSGASILLMLLLLGFHGYFRILDLNPDWRSVLTDLAYGLSMFLFAETFFRLTLFRLTEEMLGTWHALILQMLITGFVYSWIGKNQGITGFLSVIPHGLLPSVGFIVSRRIWFGLGISLGWNGLQSFLLGLPLSGFVRSGIFRCSMDGPSWIIGGSQGLNGSLIVNLLGLLISLSILRYAIDHRQWIRPVWSKKSRFMEDFLDKRT